MNKYAKTLKIYEDTILAEACGGSHGKKKKIKEEDDKKSEKYQVFFKKMLKKFGVTEPDQLKGDKKKEFYNAVDAGWKGKDEKPEANESKYKVGYKSKTKQDLPESINESINVIADILRDTSGLIAKEKLPGPIERQILGKIRDAINLLNRIEQSRASR